jgi:SAM-dependent methyltransferase
MENDQESRRLELKTDVGVVRDQARRAGLVPGMRVLDAVCGPGITTAALAEAAGAGGRAVGIDFSVDRIARAREAHGGSGTEFQVRDILEPLGDLGTFDFVWMRFALEYYRAEGFDIVRNLASVLREGGILCLVDLDYNCLSHYGMPTRLETALRHVVDTLESRANFDPYAGRKLYSHLYKLGFRDIRVEAGAHHLIYGPLREVDEYNWTRKLDVLGSRLGGDRPGYSGLEEFRREFLEFFRDPGRFTYTPVLSAWGRKPAAEN